MSEGRRYARDELAFARAVTFFDAVFAIALTLLISFVVIVRIWRSSHGELATFRHLNSRVIGLHTAVLFGVVLIPFTTEAMGEPGRLKGSAACGCCRACWA